jgi:crotonobetainyl-CoA:carnitine CoA-transferase CaiB-like acyl-CoA transferase
MTKAMLSQILTAAGQSGADNVRFNGSDPVFPLPWPVGEAGAAAIAACGVAAARVWQQRGGREQGIEVDVDAGAAAMNSNRYLKLEPAPGRAPPVPRTIRNHDIYETRDGRWLYLPREFVHHRERIAALLKSEDTPEALAVACKGWDAVALEDAVFDAGACAGVIRTYGEWQASEQGRILAEAPLLEITRLDNAPPQPLSTADRPLSGLRVLDLTRVLAGPTCARTLAEHGAEVLRIGASNLPNNERHLMDTGHGKRSAVLDLRTEGGIATLLALVKDADVFSQSYRPGSLAARGFSFETLAALRPGIVYVSLNAFGSRGPWAARRGFDTLVQTVSGISDEYSLDGKPRLLPVSALDYITGYLGAFGAMVALSRRAREGGSYHVQLSLAQTGRWLTSLPRCDASAVAARPPELSPERVAELSMTSDSPYGRLTHLAPAVRMSETPAQWARPAVPLDHDPPAWEGA